MLRFRNFMVHVALQKTVFCISVSLLLQITIYVLSIQTKKDNKACEKQLFLGRGVLFQEKVVSLQHSKRVEDGY